MKQNYDSALAGIKRVYERPPPVIIPLIESLAQIGKRGRNALLLSELGSPGLIWCRAARFECRFERASFKSNEFEQRSDKQI